MSFIRPQRRTEKLKILRNVLLIHRKQINFSANIWSVHAISWGRFTITLKLEAIVISKTNILIENMLFEQRNRLKIN